MCQIRADSGGVKWRIFIPFRSCVRAYSDAHNARGSYCVCVRNGAFLCLL